jgi:hypothetical protein
MLATPVGAGVKPGRLLTPEKASADHAAATPHQGRPVKVDILRNGKSSETVSFANKGSANKDGARKSQTHHEAALGDDPDDAGASSTVVSAHESAVDHREMAAPPPNSSVAPATAPAGASINAPVDPPSTPRTIDLE